MNTLVEEALSGSMNEKVIQKVLANNAGEMGLYACISVLFAIFALIVIIMCLKDSDPEMTEHGESPKYVNE